jgi:hypothetical protein
VSHLLYSHDGKYIISASGNHSDSTIKFWNLHSKTMESEIKIAQMTSPVYQQKDYDGAIELLRIDPKDKYLLIATYRSNTLFNLQKNESSPDFLYKHHIIEAQFTKCARYLIVGVDCSLEVLIKKTGGLLKRFALIHSGEIESIVFDDSGRFLSSCCKGKVF